MIDIAICWLRRDLRLDDHAALYHALRSGLPVLPIFIFDTNILDKLDDSHDARVHFLHTTLSALKEDLEGRGSSLLVLHGDPAEVWSGLLERYPIRQVFCNRDYEEYAIARDEQVRRLLAVRGIAFHAYKDQVIFEQKEVVKDDGLPYTVFTPYSKKWRAKLLSRPDTDAEGNAVSYYLKPYPAEHYSHHLLKTAPLDMPTLASIGFESSDISIPSTAVAQGIIRHYDQTRNFPAIHGTSRLGIHFRFGTISIREKARKALDLNDTYLNELIWRDFYAMILSNFPHVARSAFRPEYERIQWRNDEHEYQKWCDGQTGYPIVDAGMRELNTTGYMHNRVRMITASFLTKHLLIDWRWGEAYFAKKLLDFDLASNNGGWQWAAGCGTDAAPYFRIFNPQSQQEKFDKDLRYVKHWVPEYGTPRYPTPIVEHKTARDRCLEVYKAALQRDRP